MTAEIVERVLGSSRYRGVDRGLVARLAAEELPKARNVDDAVKRVKRRLHQAVGAFGGRRIATAWPVGDPEALRDACRSAMEAHASTRERLADLGRFHDAIWQVTGTPSSVLDLGCGLHPLALPWMGIDETARYVALDIDATALTTVAGFLAAVGQPHAVGARDLVVDPPLEPADVAFLLKLVPTLDRQDGEAATRLVRGLRARHAVVSFAARTLGGRCDARTRTYRERLDRLATESGRVREVVEASVRNELVFVLALAPVPADG